MAPQERYIVDLKQVSGSIGINRETIQKALKDPRLKDQKQVAKLRQLLDVLNRCDADIQQECCDGAMFCVFPYSSSRPLGSE